MDLRSLTLYIEANGVPGNIAHFLEHHQPDLEEALQDPRANARRIALGIVRASQYNSIMIEPPELGPYSHVICLKRLKLFTPGHDNFARCINDSRGYPAGSQNLDMRLDLSSTIPSVTYEAVRDIEVRRMLRGGH